MRRVRDLEVLKEDLRQAVDLVPFIQRHIPDLTLRGKRWVSLCPFHENVTNPTFAVSPEVVYEKTGSRGVLGCWSCGWNGDLFAFVERWHEANFMEAIEIVAEIVDFDLTPYYRELTQEEQLREDRYTAVEQMAELFCAELLESPGHLAFFERRGITPATLERFRVGYCPSMDFLTSNVSADILKFVEPDFYNRQRLFGDRLVYAQFTTQGRVWGWYARQPDDRTEGPKYIGTSSNAALFDGAERLYLFAQARKLLGRSKYPLLVLEGFHDALVAQQENLPAVAACGTRLSDHQIQTLQGHAIRKAIVSLDPDEAGREGMLKIASNAHKINNLQFQFALMAKEPEEFINEYGIDAFRENLENALGPIEFIVEANASMDTSTATRKRDFLDHIRPYLLPYSRRSLDRALGVQAVSRVTGLAEEVVSDYLDEKSDSPLANLAGESIVLAELALNPQAWVSLPNFLESDFSLRRNAQTFGLMQEIRLNGGDVSPELLHMTAVNNHLPHEVIETISRLPTISRKTPETFSRDVKDKAIRRQADQIVNTMRAQLGDLKSPVSNSLATMIESVTSAMVTRARRSTFSSKEAVAEAVQEMERRARMDTGIAGLDLGPDWEWYTKMINGHRGGRVNGIASASNVGKSIVAMNWVHRLSIAQNFGFKDLGDGQFLEIKSPHAAGLVASMEMSKVENVFRLAAIDSGVPHSFIEHSRFTGQEQADLAFAALDRIDAARIKWMEGQRTLREIAMEARILQARGELDYVMLDYIQLLDLSCYNDRWSVTEKYNQASQELHDLCESLDVPIICVAQLNRNAMAEDMPTGEQMGSSYKIYQDAHSFFILSPRENGLMGSLDKNRGSGKGFVKLSFDSDPQTSNLRVGEIEVMKRLSNR